VGRKNCLSGELFSAKNKCQGYNGPTGDVGVDEEDGGRSMNQVSRRHVPLVVFFGLMMVMGACSRSVASPEDPQATLIDLAPQQTLTALSLPESTEVVDSQPENTAPVIEPPPQATETEIPQASDTPPASLPTNEITDTVEKTPTGNAISVTQTMTPANIPLAGTEWTINYLDDPPDIDGDMGDWPGVIYAVNNIVFGPEFYANQIDLFGEFKLGWDDEYLYLGVLVRDSRFVQTATDALLFQGDSIEVLLDTDWSGDQSSTELSGDDYQLGFSPGNLVDISIPESYLWAPTDREGPMQMSLVQGRLTDDGYMVEIAVAWEEVGVTPIAGMTLGFLLSVSDNDTIGKNEQQTVISILETRNLTNPSTWIPVTLVNP
jgi:hypothetical protein